MDDCHLHGEFGFRRVFEGLDQGFRDVRFGDGGFKLRQVWRWELWVSGVQGSGFSTNRFWAAGWGLQGSGAGQRVRGRGLKAKSAAYFRDP